MKIEGKIFLVIKRILSFVPALFMMYIIFGFSAAGGESSRGMSWRVTEVLVETANGLDVFDVVQSPKEQQVEMLQPLVRKVAHVTEYFILCILIILPLRYSFPKIGQRRVVIAFMLCLLFAISDEWHQVFVAGRDGKAADVFIDSIGIGLSSILCRFFVS